MRTYRLNDFGRRQHRDLIPIVPVSGALLAAGAASFLSSVRSPEFLHRQDKVGAWIAGYLMLSGFLYYLDAYYRLIWAPYFSLAEDVFFFRLYAGAFALAIALLAIAPEYWPLYVLILYILLFLRKQRTRNLFQRSFQQVYPDVRTCRKKSDLARLRLAEAFTRLWLRNGVVGAVAYSIILLILLRGDYRIGEIPIASHVLRPSWFLLLSSVVVVLSLTVWMYKGSHHLSRMQRRVKDGDHKYFEDLES